MGARVLITCSGRSIDAEVSADLPSGTTDATVVALAERLGVSEVATLDRRHFSVVRSRHVFALTLLAR